MSEKRLLAVLGFLFAMIGGILLLAAALTPPGGQRIDLDFLARRAIALILGIAAILGGVLMYKGRMSTGGLLTVIIGVATLLLTGSWLEGVLVIIGGILGIVGSEARWY